MKQTGLHKITALLLGGLMALSLAACTQYVDQLPAVSQTADGLEAPGFSEGGYYGEAHRGESYQSIEENGFIAVQDERALTFSLKVDTASYTNVTRYIEDGQQPPADAVRTEELVNYFSYEQEVEMIDGAPFGIYTEVGPSIFNDDMLMAFVRVKTTEIDKSGLPPSSLVFLIDTSGSMYSPDKLPLLVASLKLLVEELDEDDRVSIVTYAGTSEVALKGTSGADKARIIAALDGLSAGGSTAGADGINTAYQLAEENFIEGGNNRVILCSDGDFNVGISSVEQLKDLIAEKRQTGVYLSVLGFGSGNLQDDIMEGLAAEGNGSYHYINKLSTGNKVLVEEMGANLFTVADDVKAQVDFHPDNVESYRLIGYENRLLDNEDFKDDSVDAGEIGAGTDVVMLFEFGPNTAEIEGSPSFFTVNIRYKEPGQDKSQVVGIDCPCLVGAGSSDFWFASSVAAFGHILRGSQYLGGADMATVMTRAEESLGRDRGGHRLEYLELLSSYRRLS